MVHKDSEAATQTNEQCRIWCQREIAQRVRYLLVRSEHQESMDKEKYKELKERLNQERVNHTELRKTL
eukprot:8395458-Prorocentrum_lima.AAC.1